jgi:hypothetical protein
MNENVALLLRRRNPPNALLGLAAYLVKILDALARSVFRRILAVVKLNIDTARRGRFPNEAYRDYVGSFAAIIIIEND